MVELVSLALVSRRNGAIQFIERSVFEDSLLLELMNICVSCSWYHISSGGKQLIVQSPPCMYQTQAISRQ